MKMLYRDGCSTPETIEVHEVRPSGQVMVLTLVDNTELYSTYIIWDSDLGILVANLPENF